MRNTLLLVIAFASSLALNGCIFGCGSAPLEDASADGASEGDAGNDAAINCVLNCDSGPADDAAADSEASVR